MLLNILSSVGSVLIILFFIWVIYSYYKDRDKDELSGEKLVLLIRLTQKDGIYSFADAMQFSNNLKKQGIESICEHAPSALMDSIDSYVIKVPLRQHKAAIALLKSTIKK